MSDHVPVTIYLCPGGCPPGQCDTNGPGVEGRRPCAHCCGTGTYDGGYVSPRMLAKRGLKELKEGDKCPYCQGDGLGGGFSSATCSKCGQAAIDRALWEGL